MQDRLAVAWRWMSRYARDLAREWSDDRVGGLAAEIAFFALLGFFPAVVSVAALLGSASSVLGAGSAADIETWIIDQMQQVFGTDNTLDATVADLFDGGNGGVLTVGALLSLYAASRGFTAVVGALDVAYDHHETRSWWATRLVGLGLTLLSIVVAVVVLVLIVVGPLFGSGAELADRLGASSALGTLWTWSRWPVVFAALVGWAVSLYHLAPSHRTPWRADLPGAVVAALWWAVVSIGFGSYLAVASSGANAVFGLLGGAISLLFWLYLMAMGLLVGAEINALRAERHGIEARARPTGRRRGPRR